MIGEFLESGAAILEILGNAEMSYSPVAKSTLRIRAVPISRESLVPTARRPGASAATPAAREVSVDLGVQGEQLHPGGARLR